MIQPTTLGGAMRLIGRYTESEGGDSAETMNARRDLFDAYMQWCIDGRPEVVPVADTPPPTDELRETADSTALTLRSFAADIRNEGDMQIIHMDESGVSRWLTLSDALWLLAVGLDGKLDPLRDQDTPPKEADHG